MTDTPLVSVVTPAYNASRFLPAALNSLKQQSMVDWEWIVVDDQSKDDSWALINRYAQEDVRIKPLQQAKNGGPAQARNAALKVARGRYIAFLDADDLWLPEKLAHQLAFMRERDAAVSFTRFRRINADGSQVGHLVTIPDTLTYQQLLRNTAIATSTAMVDREKTGPFEMTRAYYDDYVLWLTLLKRGHMAHGLQEDLMRYRVVQHSVSRNKWRSAFQVWLTYRQIEGLNVLAASCCFGSYAWNAWKKYRSF